jgi:MFS family permease
MAEEKQSGFYFGWWIVVTGFLLMGLGYAPNTTLVGLFISPMVVEFGVGATAASTMVTVMMFGSMIGSPIAGKMCMKFGCRKVVSVMLVIMIIGYIGTYWSPNLIAVDVFAFVRGFAGACAGMVPISIMINTWFGKKMLGRAMSFASVGSGIGAMALSPIIAIMIAGIGWRVSYLLLTVLTAVCIPFVLITFSPSPQAKGIVRIGDDPTESAETKIAQELTGITSGQALRTPMFWAILLAFIFMCTGTQSWINNAPGFYGSVGFEAAIVGTLVSVTSLMLTIGKLVLGVICDKLGVKAGYVISMGSIFLCYLLAVAAGMNRIAALVYVCSVLMGFGQSVLNITMPILANDLFGRKDYGTCVGYLQMGAALGASVGPLFTTMFLDTTGVYTMTFVTAGVIVALSVVLVFVSFGLRGSAHAKFSAQADEQPA